VNERGKEEVLLADRATTRKRPNGGLSEEGEHRTRREENKSVREGGKGFVCLSGGD